MTEQRRTGLEWRSGRCDLGLHHLCMGGRCECPCHEKNSLPSALAEFIQALQDSGVDARVIEAARTAWKRVSEHRDQRGARDAGRIALGMKNGTPHV